MEPIKPVFSFVIPVYNEAPRIELLYDRIAAVVAEGREVIMVDDGSSDGSFDVMKHLAETRGQLVALRLESNYGQQQATLAGLLESRGEWVCTLDADLQHPPEALPVLLAASADGADLVYGVPAGVFRHPFRQIGSALRDLVFLILLKKPVGVRLTSFRLIRGEVVRRLKKPETTFVYVSAELLQVAERITTVPVRMDPSPHKGRGYRLGSLARLLTNVVITYGNLPGLKHRIKPGQPYRIAEVSRCGS
jgi:undecaprenyl-phosphate 4-deoxy-4-formamido-L-arabinose transferase